MSEESPFNGPGYTPDPKIFVTTMWTMVLTAASKESPQQAEEALNRLCRIYWHPIHGYFARALNDPTEAEDLTQTFFATMLRRDFLADIARDKGKFRSWLLTAAKRVLLDHLEKRSAEKRGGGQRPMSIDATTEEGTPLFEPAAEQNAVEEFERDYVAATIERVFDSLESEFVAHHPAGDFAVGPKDAFGLLLPCVMKTNEAGYDEIGMRLGRTEGAVKQIVRRLRGDFERLFRAQVAETLSNPADFDDEVRYLLRVIEG